MRGTPTHAMVVGPTPAGDPLTSRCVVVVLGMLTHFGIGLTQFLTPHRPSRTCQRHRSPCSRPARNVWRRCIARPPPLPFLFLCLFASVPRWALASEGTGQQRRLRLEQCGASPCSPAAARSPSDTVADSTLRHPRGSEGRQGRRDSRSRQFKWSRRRHVPEHSHDRVCRRGRTGQAWDGAGIQDRPTTRSSQCSAEAALRPALRPPRAFTTAGENAGDRRGSRPRRGDGDGTIQTKLRGLGRRIGELERCAPRAA